MMDFEFLDAKVWSDLVSNYEKVEGHPERTGILFKAQIATKEQKAVLVPDKSLQNADNVPYLQVYTAFLAAHFGLNGISDVPEENLIHNAMLKNIFGERASYRWAKGQSTSDREGLRIVGLDQGEIRSFVDDWINKGWIHKKESTEATYAGGNLNSSKQAREASTVERRSMLPSNRILYGPPGTGKTYHLGQLLKEQYESNVEQASPEERRRQIIEKQIASLTWWEGVAATLYDLGGKAKVKQIEAHEFIQAIIARKGRTKNLTPTLWNALQNHTLRESKTVGVALRSNPEIFDKTKDSEWSFAGNWREECTDLIKIVDSLGQPTVGQEPIKRYTFVTFHQSYGYEDFVEGLRPVLDQETESESIHYEIHNGAFKDLCFRARQDSEHRYAMVIDEINRGNISKIFGELITLIEPDKREGGACAVSVTLPYSGDEFSVPQNVDIIGTMNTADRSLALLDTALRRRFEFVPMMPNVRDTGDAPLAGLWVHAGEVDIHVPAMLQAINERVEVLYDRDHTIGHAYFTHLQNLDDAARWPALQTTFRTRILPLLEEYFFEDWQKIRLVLADNQKPDSAQFIQEYRDLDGELGRLFGSDHGLESYAIKPRFALQEDAFSNPDAYRGIYKSEKQIAEA